MVKVGVTPQSTTAGSKEAVPFTTAVFIPITFSQKPVFHSGSRSMHLDFYGGSCWGRPLTMELNNALR
jgi:hypothetical protein